MSKKPNYQPRACAGCGKKFTPGGPRSKYCPKCKETFSAEIRNAGKRERRAKTRAPRKQLAGAMKASIDQLVSAAEALGKEQVSAQLLKRCMTLREELIRSRAHNAKIRKQLELDRFDKEMGGRAGSYGEKG